VATIGIGDESGGTKFALPKFNEGVSKLSLSINKSTALKFDLSKREISLNRKLFFQP
jgi:hypothetical protein